jgi:hypothetical protein
MYYSVDDDGVRLHQLFAPRVFISGLGRVNLTVTFTPPIQILNSVPQVGETVLSSGSAKTNSLPRVGAQNLQYNSSFTIIGLADVIVPAGNFEVMQVDGSVTLISRYGTFIADFTLDLAEGVGAVRESLTFFDLSETYELLESRVGNYDLAVTKIIAPRTITLTAKQPVVTELVKVQLQNRSPHSETIVDEVMLENLVSLTVESVPGGLCSPIVPVLRPGPPTRFPIVLTTKKTLSVAFEVTFDCANDPAKSTAKDPGHEDFRYAVVVNHAALDGETDLHPDDDICPRDFEPPGIDPYPNGTIIDKGCGAKKPDKTFGADVLTDVVLK